MLINDTTLREHYASLSSEQLLELHGRGTLTAQAAQVLHTVLNERGIPLQRRAAVAAAGAAQRTALETALQLRISLQASVGARIHARLIDTAILAVGMVIVLIVALAGLPSLAMSFLSPVLLYLIFADALPNGQSIGKRHAGISVVDAQSLQPCTPIQSAQRNLLALNWMDFLLAAMLTLGRGQPNVLQGTLVVDAEAVSQRRRSQDFR